MPLTLLQVVREVRVEKSELGREFADLGASVKICRAAIGQFVFLDLVQVADIADSPDTHQTCDALHVFVAVGRNGGSSSQIEMGLEGTQKIPNKVLLFDIVTFWAVFLL